MGEPQEENDLFFTCSLIEYIARKTKNSKKKIIEKLGKEKLNKIYNLAEVYHSENIEKVSDEFIEECNIEKIDNYNSSVYYENPDYIYQCYIQGKIL